MLQNPHIQLSYNAKLKRARVQFLAGECFRSRKPPRDVLNRLADRFREEMADGHIETFTIYQDRFDAFWGAIHERSDEIDPNTTFKFTVGQGGRIYDELTLSSARSSPSGYVLNASFTPKKIATIPFNAFLYNIDKRLDESGYDLPLDRAYLRLLYQALQHGQKLDAVPLLLQPSVEEAEPRGYVLRVNHELAYASLHLYDIDLVKDVANCQSLLEDLKKEVDEACRGHQSSFFWWCGCG